MNGVEAEAGLIRARHLFDQELIRGETIARGRGEGGTMWSHFETCCNDHIELLRSETTPDLRGTALEAIDER